MATNQPTGSLGRALFRIIVYTCSSLLSRYVPVLDQPVVLAIRRAIADSQYTVVQLGLRAQQRMVHSTAVELEGGGGGGGGREV